MDPNGGVNRVKILHFFWTKKRKSLFFLNELELLLFVNSIYVFFIFENLFSILPSILFPSMSFCSIFYSCKVEFMKCKTCSGSAKIEPGLPVLYIGRCLRQLPELRSWLCPVIIFMIFFSHGLDQIQWASLHSCVHEWQWVRETGREWEGGRKREKERGDRLYEAECLSVGYTRTSQLVALCYVFVSKVERESVCVWYRRVSQRRQQQQ